MKITFRDRINPNPSLEIIKAKRQRTMDRIANGSTLRDKIEDIITGERINVYYSTMSNNYVVITQDDFFTVKNIDRYRQGKPIENDRIGLGGLCYEIP